MRGLPSLAAAVALVAATSCAHTPGAEHAAATQTETADSVTVALWHFDDPGGTVVHDSGPSRLRGVNGDDTRSDFGRYGRARTFTRSVESFVLVPYSPTLETGGGFTVEAWINPAAFGQYEDTPIAARWTPQANERSWLLGIVGRKLVPPFAQLASPGYHQDLVLGGVLGHLVFAFQPRDAGVPRAFYSSRVIETGRWTHVAATFDGEVVRFYVDGILDSQYAVVGRIAESPAPLLVGNFFDPRQLVVFGDGLRHGPAADPNPYYAFEGSIDELRLSNVARTAFPSARGH